MTAWGQMEQAAVALLNKLAGTSANIQNININRNNIGTTHHEAGTLWMGASGQSVTDAFGKFHNLANAYTARIKEDKAKNLEQAISEEGSQPSEAESES